MPAVEFPDLAGFIDESLPLPYKGKTYQVPDPGPETGLYLQSLMDAAESVLIGASIAAANKRVLEDEEDQTVYRMALGAVYDEMVADKVPWRVLRTAGTTAWLYWTGREDRALAYWTSQGKAPKATTDPSSTSSDTSPTDPSTPPPA